MATNASISVEAIDNNVIIYVRGSYNAAEDARIRIIVMLDEMVYCQSYY